MSLTSSIDLTRKRGDTYPLKFQISFNGSVLDITGYTFKMTVDPEPDPSTSDNNLFQVAGFITDAAQGEFEFRPSAANMDLEPDTYYFDVEMVDTGGFLSTVVKGKLTVGQDITK